MSVSCARGREGVLRAWGADGCRCASRRTPLTSQEPVGPGDWNTITLMIVFGRGCQREPRFGLAGRLPVPLLPVLLRPGLVLALVPPLALTGAPRFSLPMFWSVP